MSFLSLLSSSCYFFHFLGYSSVVSLLLSLVSCFLCVIICRCFYVISRRTLPQIELIRRDYVANGGWETFLAYEDPYQDILIGLLRLRQCSPLTFRPELRAPTAENPVTSDADPRCSIVRELHVYGSAVPVSTKDPTKFQHQVRFSSLIQQASVFCALLNGAILFPVEHRTTKDSCLTSL